MQPDLPSHGHTARRRALLAVVLVAALLAGACGTATAGTEAPTSTVAGEAGAEPTTGTVEAPTSADTPDGTLFDATVIHDLAVSFDGGDYDALIEAYRSTGTKEWIEATVTIDGTTYEHAGIRLKGNSSLGGLRNGGRGGGPGGNADASAPEGLPWLIKLDKYVDGQSHNGISDLVVRSNNSETALNEAVALGLLELAGLASQDAVYAAFSVNGSDQVLRLVIEHPDDVWMADNFDATGALYKAESTGDYRYRGDDPDAYDEVWDQEAGAANADLDPLIEFLDFLNNADDATFSAEIEDRLDVDAFATYLAMQELIDNFDDIDGPGNNSYLHYDTATGVFTVVPWDHNLAFGGGGFGGGGGGFRGGGPDGGGRRGGPDRSNVLVERFLASDAYQALYQDKLDELSESLYAGGAATRLLDEWVALLVASDLVDAGVVSAEAASVASHFDG